MALSYLFFFPNSSETEPNVLEIEYMHIFFIQISCAALEAAIEFTENVCLFVMSIHIFLSTANRDFKSFHGKYRRGKINFYYDIEYDRILISRLTFIFMFSIFNRNPRTETKRGEKIN